MLASVRTIARRALVLAAAGVLTLGSLPASAAATLDELVEMNLRAWSGETELLDEVYAPDGVHTATFYDRTNEYTGPDEIARVARYGGIELIGPRIDLPAAEGEWRWVSFASLAGGAPCLWHAVDGRIIRHDCIVPERSTDSRPKVGLASAEASAAIDAMAERLDGLWGPGATVESLAQVYAADAVHSARFLNTTRRYNGPEEIMKVAGFRGPETIGERVDFEAPEGELAWAQASSIGSSVVCLFRAVDGMVTRHDCLLPVKG